MSYGDKLKALDILTDKSAETGWNTDSMLEIACRYIDERPYITFEQFVENEAGEEMGWDEWQEDEEV